MIKILLRFLLIFFVFTTVYAQESPSKTASEGQEKANALLEEMQKQYADGNYDLHKTYSDSLLLVAEKYKLVKMQVLALTNQAVFYNNRIEREQAVTLYHKALDLCELIPEDFRTRTVVLVNLGNTYHRIGSYQKAIATMGQVLEVARKTEDSDRIKSAALIGLSNNYTQLRDYENALKYAYEVKAIGEKNKQWETVAIALNSITDTHLQLKEYEMALEVSSAALELPFLQKPTKSRAWMLLNAGIAQYHLKRFDLALENFKTCIALAQEKQLNEVEMYGYEYSAKVYEEKEDFEASYAAQKQYTTLHEQLQNDRNQANSTDLKNEISAKEKDIANTHDRISSLSAKRKQMTIWGGCLLAILGGLLLFYIKRKKQIEHEQRQLRAQFSMLQQQMSTTNMHMTTELEENKELKISSAPYKNSSLTIEDRKYLKNQILAYMESDKPYLNTNLTQSDMANKIGISSHHFSEALHYGFQQNFYNFINSYRVQEAQQLMNKPEYKDAKIIAFAFDSGFKSKTSFNRVFKRHTGFTPSEYRASLRA